MRQYIEPVQTAVLLFPFIALAFTIPYMLVQYRKYGAILLLRTAIVYSFILYLMCAYFLTILPLPDMETVRRLTSTTIQLIPFREIADWLTHTGVNFSHPATYYRLFWNRDFFQIVANVAMLVPFGIYLRYYFGFSLKKTVCFSLGLSLIFELTQLSGFFGIYPRPYRLADVDDLMTNTFGGMLGYFIAPLFMRLLPSKERMDEVAYKRGTNVSVTRCAFGALIDAFVLLVAFMLLMLIFPALIPPAKDTLTLIFWAYGCYSASIALYFMLGEWFFKGRTLGKLLTHLRLVDIRSGGRPKLWQCAVRYSTLYLVVMPTPVIVLLMLALGGVSDINVILMLLAGIVLLLIYITFWLLLLVHLFTHSIQQLHGKLSMTRNMSTLRVKKGVRNVENDEAGASPLHSVRTSQLTRD